MSLESLNDWAAQNNYLKKTKQKNIASKNNILLWST